MSLRMAWSLEAVRQERERQVARFGKREDLDLREWHLILAEEVGELAKAMYELHAAEASACPTDVQSLRQAVLEEAVQVAACAIAIAERVQ